MGYLVRMPQMGMSMEQGTVVEWTTDEGGEVEEGETVVVVESEKAEADVEARESGVLRRIVVEAGEVVEPGTPIGIVAGADEDIAPLEEDAESEEAAAAEADSGNVAPDDAAGADAGESPGEGSAGAANSDDVRATPGARQAAADADVDLASVEGTGPGGVITEDDVEGADEATGESGDESEPAVRATPGAKRVASERGVELSGIEGTGPGGAVTEADVEAAAGAGAGETGEEGTAPAEEEPSAGGPGLAVRERRTLSGIQETIGERLSESYRNAVHVTLNREIETAALEEQVDGSGTADVDLSYNDFLLCAVGEALVDHPEFNAHFEDGTHVLYDDVDVGLAVDTGEGLLTPVVRDVDEKDAAEVNEVRTELTERVLEGDHTMDDLRGGTFTVSNLGAFGVDSFDPVIDPPQIAILGVGRVRGDGTMTLSLSFDHRVVNGADAARFLGTVAENLADAATLAGYLPGA